MYIAGDNFSLENSLNVDSHVAAPRCNAPDCANLDQGATVLAGIASPNQFDAAPAGTPFAHG